MMRMRFESRLFGSLVAINNEFGPKKTSMVRSTTIWIEFGTYSCILFIIWNRMRNVCFDQTSTQQFHYSIRIQRTST